MFFHLSPKKIGSFTKAYELKMKMDDRKMLLQATYIYEAFQTVMANSFGKKKVEWRTKTFTEEHEEQEALKSEEKRHELLRQHANELDTLRRNFLLEKKRLDGEKDEESRN